MNKSDAIAESNKKRASNVLQMEKDETNKKERIHTDKELAKMAGVGTGTIARYNRVMNSDEDRLMDGFVQMLSNGEIGGSAKKVGKRIKELERLYGIQNGSTSFQGNQYEVVTNKSEAPKKTQEQLAAQMDISVDTLQNYKILSEMIPELEDLIETNLRQRVVGNANPIKLGKCFQFLNNWYGFERGAKSFQWNQHKEVSEKFFHSPDSDNRPYTQKELAQDYGITQQTMNNYMRLTKAIPELENLIDTGVVTKRRVLPFTYIIIRRNSSGL